MTGIVAGLISVLVMSAFLGGTAWVIGSVPLWIIVLIGLALMVIEYVDSARESLAANRPKTVSPGEAAESFVRRNT